MKSVFDFNSSNVFIIAEAGVNCNGKLDLALQLVDVAAEAGADAVKFQTFKAEQVVTEKGEMALYQKKNMGKVMSQRDMLRKLELREEFYDPLMKRCTERNITFLSTPHGGKESVDFLESLNVALYKVGSGDLTNDILLFALAKTKKPIILSSGMATMAEVKHAIQFLKNKKSGPLQIFHCTTNYPCPPEEVNMAAMVTMMKTLDIPVGYSDHTLGIQAAIMAAALGAKLYECHFTLDKSLPGPDHKASADPIELKKRIQAIRLVETYMGNAKKVPTKNEINCMVKTVRKSVVASHDIPKDHTIVFDDLEAKRPGTGISPTQYMRFIGRRTNKTIHPDQLLTFSDFYKK